MEIITTGNYKTHKAWPVGSDFRCRNRECGCVFRVNKGDAIVVDQRDCVYVACPECDFVYMYEQTEVLTQA